MRMKTGALFMLAIYYGVLQCIMSALALTRLPQYKVAVLVGNYINPYQHRPYESRCTYGHSCKQSCCDGFSGSSFNCRRCDSFFIYCLRNVDTLTAGCPKGRKIMRSTVNPNDTSVDFSQNIVLGLDNPLILQGLNDTWNGVQLYVRIWDQDLNGSELIDEVRWNIIQPVGVPSGMINLTGFFGIVTIEVSITVLCVPGFTGMMCEEDIDDCVGVPCNGNGQCVDGVNSFTCNCTSGFTGALCNEIDECANVTCSGNGQCVDYDGQNDFICVCYPGFTGEICQIDIDDCVGVNCSSNRECVDEVNTFTCECSSGYSGPLCTKDLVDEGKQNISVIPIIIGGTAGVLILILILSLLVIITLTCACRRSEGAVKDNHSGKYWIDIFHIPQAASWTQRGPVDALENMTYGYYDPS